MNAERFDEAYYLQQNPDVAEAVVAGIFPSALDHYERCGREEGRAASGPVAAVPTCDPSFDEAWYLRAYPDVAGGVARGEIASGFDHWMAFGRNEGRIAPPGYGEGEAFDTDWYVKTYPMVRPEIESGRATDPWSHYLTIGRHRGYLVNRFASRPDNPSAIPSRFGGLWLDHANALDVIDGRREIGQLTSEQAEMLGKWVRDGYIIQRQAIPAELLDRAAEDLHRAYAGGFAPLRFHCPAVGGYEPIPWSPAVREHPAKALDLHWYSQSIRDLIFAPQVRACLELIFERRALAAQSLTFLYGSTQGYHQDTLYVPFSLPTQFVASWIALEDVTPGGGELSYYVGSHKLPDYLYAGAYKTLWDAKRMLRSNSLHTEQKDYSKQLEKRCVLAGLKPERLMAKKGDVLFWHADLVHGGLPISQPPKTRASVVTHYCPREVASLAFERGNTETRSHRDMAWYATSYYAGK